MYQPIPLPTSIAFEPINLCNAKCYCCPYTTLSEDKTYHGKAMSQEQIGTLLHDYGSLIKKYQVKDYTCAVSPWRYSDPLVQPNLEYIMELCNHYKIKIGLCTNGVSFTKKQCEILNKYIHLTGNIHMSVIGHTEKELWEFMKIKKSKTLESLKFVKENYPNLSKKIRNYISHISKASGIILLITGILIITNQLQFLGFYLLEIFPWFRSRTGWLSHRYPYKFQPPRPPATFSNLRGYSIIQFHHVAGILLHYKFPEWYLQKWAERQMSQIAALQEKLLGHPSLSRYR